MHNALLAQVVDSLATLFPATPGGAGTKQGLIVYLFRGQAVSRALLLAFSVGMNIALTVVNLVLGLIAIGLMARTLSFKRLRQDSRREQEQACVMVRARSTRSSRRGRSRASSPTRWRTTSSVGAIVRIPFGRSRARGIVVSLADAPPAGVEVRPVEAVVGQVPPALVELALWLADYYGSTPGARARARRARDAEAAQGAGAAGRAAGARRRGRAARRSRAPQVAAVERIVAAIDGGGGNLLLHGATGSGKTEVYLQACAAVLERGLGAIVLVPEIALAPQTVGRVRARFGDRVAILHSALTDAERRDERERIASGEARIVVGARSAVFAPRARASG